MPEIYLYSVGIVKRVHNLDYNYAQLQIHNYAQIVKRKDNSEMAVALRSCSFRVRSGPNSL